MCHYGCSIRDMRLGLRSAARTREAANWASWADTLHGQTSLSGRAHGVPSQRGIMVAKFANCQSGSDRVGWDSQSPVNQPNHGWQKFGQRRFRRERVGNGAIAKGPFRFGPIYHFGFFSAFPFSFALCVRSCRCGRFVDVFGHHRAVCSRRGVGKKRRG